MISAVCILVIFGQGADKHLGILGKGVKNRENCKRLLWMASFINPPWVLSFRIGLGFKTTNRSWIQDLRNNRRPPSKLRSWIGAEVVDQAEVVPVL